MNAAPQTSLSLDQVVQENIESGRCPNETWEEFAERIKFDPSAMFLSSEQLSELENRTQDHRWDETGSGSMRSKHYGVAMIKERLGHR